MRILTTAGGTLFHVAASELNDATQWNRIAQANNLSDPILTGLVTLLIPDRDPQGGGGIVR
jgi:nucleoid-associated protein YgaU